MLLLAAITTGAFAQTTIRVEAPNMVSVDEQFNLTFIIEGEDKPSNFSWTINSDFQLVWGPQKGSSTSISIVNGKRTKSSQYTYTYILSPTKTGTFTLPAATAQVKGRQISSRSATIQVLSGGGQGSGAASSAQTQREPSRRTGTAEVTSDDLFLRFNLSKTSAVIGEPIYATLKIYSNVNISGFEDAKLPSFNGFWSQETAPSQIQFQRESVGGRIYDAALIRSYVIIPQQAGDLRIDPAELVTLVSVRSQRRSGSIFDDFFDNGFTTVRKRVTTPPVTVHVSNLPAGAPASFGGGVGNYTISAKVSRDSLKTHDAASLIVTVSGRGNVSLLEAPKVNFPPDMDVYDTKATVKSDKGSTTGSKTFEYPFIPRSHGDFVLDPIDYSYYDVNAGKYVTLSTKPIPLHVEKGAVQESQGTVTALPGVDRKGVRNLGEDIRYITVKTPSLRSGRSWFVGSTWYWVVAAVLALLTALVWLLSREAAARRADVAGTKNRKATKMAMGRLKLAREFQQKGLQTAFYEELHRALLGFISDKLNIGAEDLNKEEIARRLEAAGVEASLGGRFNALLDACEFARYAPEGTQGTLEGHYDEAVQVISSIDASMKGHHKPLKGAALSLLLLMALPAGMTAAPVQDEDLAPVQQEAPVDQQDAGWAESLWQQGVGAYEQGQWAEACAAWETLSGAGIVSAPLQYNLGNAYFKAGDLPRAILSWERTLKLDPSHADARFNLQFAGNLTQDRIDAVPEFIFKAWLRKLCYGLSSNTWAILGLVLFAAFLAMLLLFLLGPTSAGRKTGFFTGIVLLLLCVGTVSFALWQRNEGIRADSAVVMRPVAPVKSAPSSGTDLFVLHEGTKVRLLDDVGEWKNIALADGRQGWIRTKDIEVI